MLKGFLTVSEPSWRESFPATQQTTRRSRRDGAKGLSCQRTSSLDRGPRVYFPLSSRPQNLHVDHGIDDGPGNLIHPRANRRRVARVGVTRHATSPASGLIPLRFRCVYAKSLAIQLGETRIAAVSRMGRGNMTFTNIVHWGNVDSGTIVVDSHGYRYIVESQVDEGFSTLRNLSGGTNQAMDVFDPIDHARYTAESKFATNCHKPA